MTVRVSSTWLKLREPADAAARSTELVDRLRSYLSTSDNVIHDLGCGNGSMGRWLAPRLPGRQRWVLYDHDPDLLVEAAAGLPGVPVVTRQRDVTRLGVADLAGASLVTASALLDMLTRDEVERIAAACVGAGCPALLTLSVVGRVELSPSDPLDAPIAAAFNAHQRRTVDGRCLLGPDASRAMVDAFARRGVSTMVRTSPWRLGPEEAGLLVDWFDGWLEAAIEQRPELAQAAGPYARRRRAQALGGDLTAVVHHDDLLAGRLS